MKMSPLTLYCENCGAANTAETTECFACQEPLQVSVPANFVQAPALPLPTPSPPPTPSEQLLPGALLHQRYEVVSEVGQGGFSVVYVAKDTQHKNKKVAIKQIPPVIFRDVKPSNIMRTSQGRLYLIDFGIARHFTAGQNKDTGPLGSPGYAAPEQYGTAQTTARADIYSLGATLEALLSDKIPWNQRQQQASLFRRSSASYWIACLSKMRTKDQRLWRCNYTSRK